MMDIPEVNISALHEAIKEGLKAKFPGVDVDFYDRPGEKVRTPSIRFGLEMIERANPGDTGTEQLEVKLNFAAQVSESYKAGKKLAVRVLAAQVSKFVDGNRFGLKIGPGEFTSSGPEEFSDEYETWRVEWEHTAALGKSVWDHEGDVPTEVFANDGRIVGDPDFIEIT